MASREEVLQFVEETLGFTPTSQTKFWWDTGVAGLDVIAFWEQFCERFGADLDNASSEYDYGDSDGGLEEALSVLWRRMTFRHVPSTHHFTIDHLVEVANRKKWFDPEV